jgi:hypothetical protein
VAKVPSDANAGRRQLDRRNPRGRGPATAKEVQTLKKIVESERVKIQSACDAVAGHWDERTRRIAAECFLLPLSGPSPEQAATIKRALSRMHIDTRGDVTIKLMGAKETAELNGALGCVMMTPTRKLAEKGHSTVRNMWTGKTLFPGTVRINRKFLKDSPGLCDWIAGHELSHRAAGTVDCTDSDMFSHQHPSAGYVDVDEYFQSGKIRFRGLPTNLDAMICNADSYMGLITKLHDTRVPASGPRRNVETPRHQLWA